MGRDRQEPAGCRGWSPLCLVTTLLMPLVPGSATEESAYLCLSFQPSVWCLLLFPPLSQRPCLQEDSECQLQVGESLCPVLKGESSTPSFLPMAPVSKPPTLHVFINAMTYCGVSLVLAASLPFTCHFKVRQGKSREIKFMVTTPGQFW